MRACKKSAPFHPIWPPLALFGPFGPFGHIWPRKALFGLIWPRLTPFGPFDSEGILQGVQGYTLKKKFSASHCQRDKEIFP